MDGEGQNGNVGPFDGRSSEIAHHLAETVVVVCIAVGEHSRGIQEKNARFKEVE